MQSKVSPVDLEARIEAASQRVDRDARDMLQALEDDVRERDYEERLYAQQASGDRFQSFENGW